MDEFHHGAAATYRRLIEHFQPGFMLGLTATPDRTDGADLLALCEDNLVYRCDMPEGIARGFLSPFHDFGVPDEIDYAQIPWRNTHLDEAALTEAVATQRRAQNALDQLLGRGHGPAIGFCVSRRHAEFMARFFNEAGLRAVAVHSGESSAPRTLSIEALGAGELDILFAVDMFYEGVDVPEIGTVLMLRPTESVILFLQQLGRGLRLIEGKTLRVIDYIGNHRVFLTKARALLAAGEGDRSIAQRLELLADGQLDMPPGCEITYDLEALDLLRAMVAGSDAQDEGEAWYRIHILREGRRPDARDFATAGSAPDRTGHGSWFEFVRDTGDDVSEDVFAHLSLMRAMEARQLPCPVGPTLLQVLSERRDATVPSIRADVEAHLASSGLDVTSSQWIGALNYWRATPHISEDGDRLMLRRDLTSPAVAAVRELTAWRTASVKHGGAADEASGPDISVGSPELWAEHMREEIPPLFGESFNPGNWNAGIVKVGRGLVLLTTL